MLKAQKPQTNGKKKVSKPSVQQDPAFNAQHCQYYVFQLVCKDCTVEYVVEGYLPFKYITAAFEDLVAQKESITRVNKRIEILQELPEEDEEQPDEDEAQPEGE